MNRADGIARDSVRIDETHLPMPADLLQAHPVPTFLLDAQSRLCWANQAAEALCNMACPALVGLRIFDVVRFADRSLVAMIEAADKGCAAYTTRCTPQRQPEVKADVQVTVVGARGATRLLTIQPLPRVREVAPSGASSNSRAARFAGATLAHEIKNPLAGIRGAAQLLARNAAEGDGRFTDLICREVDRIAALVDRMQDFTRDSPRPVSPVNLYPALQQARDIVFAGQQPNPVLIEEFDPSIPDALVDHDAVVQIMINLLKNAVEALHSTPRAVVRLSTAFRHGLSVGHGDGERTAIPIEIRVSDNGPGVPEALVDDLFTPFVSGRREGHGLGLALVDKLVRDMGGLVQYSRDDIEGWSHFVLHLPMAGGRSR